MAVKFSNNGKTTLASGITNSATSITVNDGSVFPSLSGSDTFFMTLEDTSGNVEIVSVSAVSSNTLTVTRAQEGTTARAFSTGDKAENRLTAAGLNSFSTEDADGDTKIQVEEGTDDDTIRFDTAGSERLIITPTGNVGINTTTPYDSQWGTDGNNTELAIEGGSTGYGIIHLRGTGAGSTDTRFSMGVGDTKYYMAYDRIDGAHRMIMNTDGAIGFSTSDVGFETLTINKVGSSSYGSIQLRRSDTDGDNNGGILTFSQKDDASTSWLGLAGWDNGTDRTIYLGGGNWGVEEATAVVLYGGAYDAGTGGATESARFSATFNMLKRATTVQASGVALKVDSTNSNTFKQRWEDNGTTVGHLGANSSVCFYAGDASGNGRFFVSQNAGEVKQISGTTNAYYRFHSNGADRNYVYQSSGNVIGFLTTSGGWAFQCDNSGNVTATGNVTAYSDIRLKDDIEPIEGALERVSKLQGVEYTRKSTGEREMGFIAQEVIEHEPTLVDTVDTSTSETDEAFADLHVMKYQNTVALLVEAVKEQQVQIEEMRAELEELKNGSSE